ncbi:MFS transporter, partial [Rhodococcus opacus]|nr:MFS transporter [Rhodococcus opacus]
GGLLIGAGFANNVNFYIFAGIALAGGLVTWFVPRPVQSVSPVRSSDRPVPTTVDV